MPERMTVRVGSQRRYSLSRVIHKIRSLRQLRNTKQHGRRCSLGRPFGPQGLGGVILGDRVVIMEGHRLECLSTENGVGVIEIGSGTAANPRFHVGSARSVKIGKNCLFASDVFITDHDHDFEDGDIPPIKSKQVIVDPVEIDDGCWIGEGVKILRGVRIGKNSIIGAGSVVTRSVPDGSIAVGMPARVVKQWSTEMKAWDSVKQAEKA